MKNETATADSRRLSLFAEGGYNRASGDRRGMAFLCDLLIVVLIVAVECLAEMILWFEGVIEELFEFPWFELAPVLTVVLYVYLFHALGGRTPGKWFMGIRVVAEGGKSPGLWRAFLRMIGYAGNIVLLLIPLLLAALTRGRTLQDRVSGTWVIEEREIVPVWRPAAIYLFWILFAGYVINTIWQDFRRDIIKENVSQAHSDMHNLALLIEQYQVDHDVYPTAVWTAMKDDPFRRGRKNPAKPETFAYRYITSGTDFWVLTSDGPDGDADFALADMIGSPSPHEFFHKQLKHNGGKYPEYDPTNGIDSSGDLYRAGP